MGAHSSPPPVDAAYEAALRPKRLADFVGQEKLRRNLEVFIRASQERGEPLDHILLCGLPGLGKTTLAHIVAAELGVRLHTTAGPALERAFDVVGLLTKLEAGDVLFIDEIHRLPRPVEEYLYTAMEDFRVDIVLDKGPGARSLRMELQPFTLIGATTREGLLTPPLRSRFGVLARLEPYTVAELTRLLLRNARLLGVTLTHQAARLVAERSRGTPRVANRYLRRLRDFAQVEGVARIDAPLAARALERLGVDAWGLESVDRKLLAVLADADGPVGLKTLAAALGEEERTLEEVYEPHLLRAGLILKTPRGRVLTEAGRRVLGRPDDRRTLFS